jgi:hypothetical protein
MSSEMYFDLMRCIFVAGEHIGNQFGYRVQLLRAHEESHLYRLNQPVAEMVGRKRLQKLRVDDGKGGQVEGANLVLVTQEVNACLSAQRRVHHRQQGCRHVNQRQSAVVNAGDEAGRVQQCAPADGYDEIVVARHAHARKRAQSRLNGGESLGSFADGKEEHLVLLGGFFEQRRGLDSVRP